MYKLSILKLVNLIERTEPSKQAQGKPRPPTAKLKTENFRAPKHKFM